MPRPTTIAVTLLTALFLIAGTWLAGKQSVTFDEVAHLGAGFAYLRGDFRLNREHPPLAKVLGALALPSPSPEPVLSTDLADLDAAQWSFGRQVLYSRADPVLPGLRRARVPIVVLSALLVPLVAVATGMARRSATGAEFRASEPPDSATGGGSPSARGLGVAEVVAALFAATCPSWIAHGTLVTTDALATVASFAAAVFAASMARSGGTARRGHAALVMACAAAAMATKYSMVAMLGLVGAASLWDARTAWRKTDRYDMPAIVAGALPALCVGLGALLGFVFAWGVPPSPGRYVDGLLHVGVNHAEGHRHYLFGELYDGRIPAYFVLALLIKLPFAQLVALTALTLRRRVWRVPAVLWLPALGYFLLMSWKAPPLGVRYVLPVLPVLCVAGGLGAESLLDRVRLPWVRRSLLLLLLGAQGTAMAQALRDGPIPWSNGLGCHSDDDLPCLDDSNLDWGQALPALAAYRDQAFPGEPVRILYFGSSPVEPYVALGEKADRAELSEPRPALYAVSQHIRARSPRSWVRAERPITIVGGVYAIFDRREIPEPAR
jgi:hypothetical protein